ncbi:methylmalonyl-CoA mutase family protein [Rhodococcus sp. Q]|uniref:methylmalonyl-CoA mutase family protein n=1 Tax=Rhodococcus sp. Q TaxID=2502252 RepID=UPI0010F492D0|nr:methylmalonyl-CoA mutase family protein [Rhodococcus sp. Q]
MILAFSFSASIVSAVTDIVETSSGIPLEAVYGPTDTGVAPPAPGAFPFTRGNFSSGYRGRLWTFRQYSGFGTAEESNRRYRYLLEQGGTGLSVALDLPTQCGYDSDDPEVTEEVGRVGVAVDTLADAEVLFDGIPLDKISTSFTINGTAAILLAFYVAAAERKGVPREKLTGTIQNDILKEYASRGTWIWPPEPSLRLIADTIEFCAAEVPRFNAISVAGAHFRDAGANAVQEMSFTLADGVTYCDTVVERGRMTIDEFAPQISFFFYTHGDFFEEIAKYRAGRRRWATIVRERYGATTDKAAMFRFGCVAGGASLYAPQAQNNLVRVAYESMASVLGGVQSMFTAAWDEPFALPSEESATLALRTQQILAYETGVTRVADPLGGSYFVEALTDATEAKIIEIMADLEAHGGMVRAIEDGYLQGLIADEAYTLHKQIEAGERPVVGVNKFTSNEPAPEIGTYELDAEGRELQLKRLAKVKAERDPDAVRTTLAALSRAAEGTDNLMHSLIDCANAYCTVGEMVSALKAVWGEFQQPVVF